MQRNLTKLCAAALLCTSLVSHDIQAMQWFNTLPAEMRKVIGCAAIVGVATFGVGFLLGQWRYSKLCVEKEKLHNDKLKLLKENKDLEGKVFDYEMHKGDLSKSIIIKDDNDTQQPYILPTSGTKLEADLAYIVGDTTTKRPLLCIYNINNEDGKNIKVIPCINTTQYVNPFITTKKMVKIKDKNQEVPQIKIGWEGETGQGNHIKVRGFSLQHNVDFPVPTVEIL